MKEQERVWEQPHVAERKCDHPRGEQKGGEEVGGDGMGKPSTRGAVTKGGLARDTINIDKLSHWGASMQDVATKKATLDNWHSAVGTIGRVVVARDLAANEGSGGGTASRDEMERNWVVSGTGKTRTTGLGEVKDGVAKGKTFSMNRTY